MLSVTYFMPFSRQYANISFFVTFRSGRTIAPPYTASKGRMIGIPEMPSTPQPLARLNICVSRLSSALCAVASIFKPFRFIISAKKRYLSSLAAVSRLLPLSRARVGTSVRRIKSLTERLLQSSAQNFSSLSASLISESSGISVLIP